MRSIAFRNLRPDVVLLDLNLPNSSGLELLRRLLLEDKAANVLIFSMHAEPLYASRAINSGASGYISKGAAAEELVAAIRRVVRGRSLRRARNSRANGAHAPSGRGSDAALDHPGSRYFATARGRQDPDSDRSARGVTYKTIANSCTVIKEKLGVARTADLIRLAIEMREQR